MLRWISVQKPSARSERSIRNKDDERSPQDPTPGIPRHGKINVTELISYICVRNCCHMYHAASRDAC